MKYTQIQNYLLVVVLSVFLVACTEEETITEANGTVKLSDEMPCTCVIQLDNGTSIVPTEFPESFSFFDGQRVNMNYQILSDDKLCNNAKSTLIHSIEEITATPYVDLYFFNYDSLKNDAITVLNYELVNDILNIEVGYSGCSDKHKIDLVWNHPWCGTPPIPPPTFELRHDSNNEECEMYVTEIHSFDISGLQINNTNEVPFMFCYTNGELETMCDDISYSY